MQFHLVFSGGCTFYQCNHFIQETFAGFCSYFYFDLIDNTFVPPVTDDLSPPASRITGATFTGDRTFINGGNPFNDLTIHRYNITCFANKYISFFQL